MTDYYDRIDQWLDWGDHTVTVDPIGNSAWIHEGQEGKHLQTRDRGKAYDASDTRHLMKLLAQHKTPSVPHFLPTYRDLERLPKFPSRRSKGCDTWRGDLRDVRGVGQLPVISQKIRDMQLPDTDKGVIERAMYSEEHARSARVLSRDGVPDHGVEGDHSVCF